jgi:hypothetical protein
MEALAITRREKMQLMLLMQQHFTQLLHLQKKNFSFQEDNNVSSRVIVVATAHCRWVATSQNSNPN